MPAAASRSSPIAASMASATACASVGSTRSAAPPHVSGSAPRSDATTGTPQAIASTTGRPNPSCRLGSTNASAPA
jgi:hypothetical protein